jgi:hypothetical protein
MDPPKEKFEEFQNFFNTIFKVNPLSSLEKFNSDIKYNGSIISLKNSLYSFNTITDLKYAIYEAFNKLDEAAPNNQLIYYRSAEDRINPLDFSWDLPSRLIKPGKLISEFITSSGEKQPIQISLYNNLYLKSNFKTFKILSFSITPLSFVKIINCFKQFGFIKFWPKFFTKIKISFTIF